MLDFMCACGAVAGLMFSIGGFISIVICCGELAVGSHSKKKAWRLIAIISSAPITIGGGALMVFRCANHF